VLIGTIIAKWDDWKDSIMKIIRVAFYPLIKVLESLGIIDDETERIRQKNHEAQMRRIKKENDALKEDQKIRLDNLKHEIAVAKARGDNTEDLESKLLKLSDDYAKQRIKSNAREIDALQKQAEEGNQEKIDELNKLIDEDKALRKKAKRDAEIQEAITQKEEKDKEKQKSEQRQKNWEKRKQEKQKEFEEELQMLRDKMQKELDMEEEMQDLIIENMEDEDAKTLAKLQLQHERELAALRDKYGIETQLEIELLKKQARELDEAKKQIAEKSKNETD
jgi:hypothetical protein